MIVHTCPHQISTRCCHDVLLHSFRSLSVSFRVKCSTAPGSCRGSSGGKRLPLEQCPRGTLSQRCDPYFCSPWGPPEDPEAPRLRRRHTHIHSHHCQSAIIINPLIQQQYCPESSLDPVCRSLISSRQSRGCSGRRRSGVRVGTYPSTNNAPWGLMTLEPPLTMTMMTAATTRARLPASLPPRTAPPPP